MPIMAASEWSDDRSAALLMCRKALECLQDESKVSSSKVVLNNVYRLLEAFKANPFFGSLPEEAAEPPDMEPGTAGAEPHAAELRFAIEEALKTTFTDQPPDTAVTAIESVLQGLVAPQRFKKPQKRDRDQAVQFFSELSHRLAFA